MVSFPDISPTTASVTISTNTVSPFIPYTLFASSIAFSTCEYVFFPITASTFVDLTKYAIFSLFSPVNGWAILSFGVSSTLPCIAAIVVYSGGYTPSENPVILPS